MKKKYILILLIDHKSTSEQIIIKSLKYLKKSKNKFLLIGNASFYKKIKKKIPTVNVLNKNFLDKKLLFFNVSSQNMSNFKYINKITDICIDLLKKKIAKVVINMPINKKKFLLEKFPGYTEFFARKINPKKKESMLLFNENLSVLPVTTHYKISEVSNKLNKHILLAAIKNVYFFYKKIIKKKINIKILGLNPHAGIDYSSSSEEKKIIIPVIKKMQKKINNIKGPISADTAFLNLEKLKKNCIIGMYHDQVLPTFKTLFNFDGLNITIGLKYLRLSPDHGTGLDILNKKKINNLSFKNCIIFCEKYLNV